MRYPYHGVIRKRIRNGELVSYRFVEDYPGVGECLLLEFNTIPALRPIRPHRYFEYVDILADWAKENPHRAAT